MPQSGYPLELIDIAGLKRRGLWLTLRSLFEAAVGAVSDDWSFASPVAERGRRSGWLCVWPRRAARGAAANPTVVLEQNSVPGVTNRILARALLGWFTRISARRSILSSTESVAAGQSGAQIHHGGKPRCGRTNRAGATARARWFAGAKAVNTLVVDALADLAQQTPPGLSPLSLHLYVHHQTGASDLEATQARYGEHPTLKPWVRGRAIHQRHGDGVQRL